MPKTYDGSRRSVLVVKSLRRAYRHVEVAWKLCREAAELEPGLFGDFRYGDAHAVVKPLADRLNAIIRNVLKQYTGRAE